MFPTSLFRTVRSGRLLLGCALILLLSPVWVMAELVPENLVLYLPCEDAQNPIDASLDPTTITVHGSISSADGKFGTKGFGFNGENANRLECAGVAKLGGMTALTVEAWMLPQNIASHSGMTVISKRVGKNNGDAYNLFTYNDTRMRARINAAGANELMTTTALEDDTWYHIAMVFDAAATDGDNMKLYVNGILEASHTIGVTAVNDSDSPVWIGELDATRGLAWDGILDEIGVWNVALTEEEISLLLSQTKEQIFRKEQARSPEPTSDETDVLYSTTDLTWIPGQFATTHDVYFGTSFDDVNEATQLSPEFKGNVTLPEFVLQEPLTFGTTYYWRIDEVNDTNSDSPWKGNVWSFTVEPEGYPVTIVDANASSTLNPVYGVENTYNRSGITEVNGVEVHDTTATHMWKSSYLPAPASLQYSFDKVYSLHELRIWNANEYGEQYQGLGIKDVTLSTSLDGETWDALGDFVVPQGPGAEAYVANPPIALNGVVAQHVKITIHSNYSFNGATPQFSISEVQFTHLPLRARYLKPTDGTVDVDPDLAFMWRKGRGAASETLSIGTDLNNLDRVIDNVSSPYDTTSLDLKLGETYAWNITASHPTMIPLDWVSDSLSFTIADFLVVDDFDGYNDDWGNMVFQTWTDGLGWEDSDGNTGAGNGSGSAVGHWPPPTMETTIVRSGKSMVFAYGLANAADSYATRNISADWSKHGIKSLSLWFYGGADNLGGQLYVKINNTRFDYTGAATDIQTAQWFPWTIDLAGISSVDSLTIGVEGGSGTIYVDDMNLSPFADEPVQ